ncbi:MAG: hypothetical protein E1N59_2837 [Puniceicoccaceae bacterium 5H]|nr:MAG: hypothetical protein E1N59_2837 [Puniceicoccaceae bacterium 5H]
MISVLEPYAIPLEAVHADQGSNCQPGFVYASNESRFDESQYSEPLTNYIVGGWDSDPLEQLLEFYAPGVQVPRLFEYKEFLHSDEFWSDDGDEDVREIYADFARVKERGAVDKNGKTLNKGLTIVLDRDKLNGPFSEQQETMRLMQRLKRNEIRRAINLLKAAATNVNLTWDTTAGKDPEQDIRNQLLLSQQAVGLRPNRVGYGETAWEKRVTACRAQNNAGGYASAAMSVQQVGSFLNVESITATDARYKGASTLTPYVANQVLMFYAVSGLGVNDPSCIKRFVSPVEGGGRIRVYRREMGPKLIAITVEHYSSIVLTSTLGIRKATIS